MECIEIFKAKNKKTDPARIRAWNPLIRSQMPHPLVLRKKLGRKQRPCFYYEMTPILLEHLNLLGKRNDPARIRTWNPLIRSQMPYPLGHEAVHTTSLKEP